MAAPFAFSRTTYACALKFSRETLKWLIEISHLERMKYLFKCQQDLFMRLIDGPRRAPRHFSRLVNPSRVSIREAVNMYIEVTAITMRTPQ